MPFKHLWKKKASQPPPVPVPAPNPEPIHLGNSAHIPNNLHFIWVGGQAPPKQMDNFCRWVEENPAYEITFWTEACLAEESALTVYRTLQQSSSIPIIDIARSDASFKIESERNDGRHSLIFISPITNLPHFCDMAQVYEEIHTWRNYGAASDILRIAVLHEYGGIYMDFDTYSKGSSLPTNIIAPKGILFGGANPEEGTMHNTNAVIAAPRHAYELKEINEIIKKQYSESEYTPVSQGVTQFTEEAQERLRELADVRRELKERPDDPNLEQMLIRAVKYKTWYRSGPAIIDYLLMCYRNIDISNPEVDVYNFQKQSGANIYIDSEASWIK